MKIVCLVRPAPHCIYFCNKIYEINSDVKVVIEKKSIFQGDLNAKIRKVGYTGIVNYIKKRILPNKIENQINVRFFGNSWKSIRDDIQCMETEDINSLTVKKYLQQIKPDIILDHGTSILHENIYSEAKIALNLHWGLSPYYRGTNCTDWALINWDPYNIGVTIHRLSNEIDGGNVLVQKRAILEPQDTVYSINMQLTYLGTNLLIQIIKKMSANLSLKFHIQDYSLGYLTYMRQWSRHSYKLVRNIECNSLISKMLEKPARSDKLPIIELS
jgi:hypothetical protein